MVKVALLGGEKLSLYVYPRVGCRCAAAFPESASLLPSPLEECSFLSALPLPSPHPPITWSLPCLASRWNGED